MAKAANMGEKPHSAVTVWIDSLCSTDHDEDDLDGIPELVESINLQATGPTEASRAIRKKVRLRTTGRLGRRDQRRALTGFGLCVGCVAEVQQHPRSTEGSHRELAIPPRPLLHLLPLVTLVPRYLPGREPSRTAPRIFPQAHQNPLLTPNQLLKALVENCGHKFQGAPPRGSASETRAPL